MGACPACIQLTRSSRASVSVVDTVIANTSTSLVEVMHSLSYSHSVTVLQFPVNLSTTILPKSVCPCCYCVL